MLSLWKLRVGAEAYYLGQVAQGLDDYYTGQGEMPGRWLGNAIGGLGLGGTVTGDDLRAVLAGLNPGTGQIPQRGPVAHLEGSGAGVRSDVLRSEVGVGAVRLGRSAGARPDRRGPRHRRR